MPTVKLNWSDQNNGAAEEDGFKIYRSNAPLNLAALPTPIAILPSNTVTYDDAAALSGDNYYIVSAFRAGAERFSPAILITVGGGILSAANLVLDSYPSTLLAGGFRLLKTGYLGGCCQIRRSSDSTTLNIGFANGIVDSAAIASFCGVSDGFISILYDQNQVDDFVQSSVADQPKIYDGASGAVIVNGAGNPAMKFDNSRTHLRTTINPSVNMTMNLVVEAVASDTSFLAIWEGISTTRFVGAASSGSTASFYSNAGTPVVYIDGVSASAQNRDAIYSDLNAVANQARVLGLEALGVTGWSGIRIFGYDGSVGGVWQYGGLMSEIVIWDTAEITNANFLAAATKSRLAWA